MQHKKTVLGSLALLLLIIIAPVILTAQMQNDAPPMQALALTPTLPMDAAPQFVPTVDPFPRPTSYEIIVAEQVFENGRMFYLLPADRIWVMFNDDDGDFTQGAWEVYENPFSEGEREADPNLQAPDDLVQPIRGFGKVWRDNRDIAAMFGWALDDEIGHFTEYRFFPGERRILADGMEIEPGYHALRSFYGELFVFNEGAGTWCLFDTDNLNGDDESDETSPLPCIQDADETLKAELLAALTLLLEAENDE